MAGKRNARYGWFVLSLAAIGVLAAGLASTSGASSGPIVSIDAIPDGANTATSVGTIDKCRIATKGAVFDVDMVIQNVVGLTGMEAHLLYNPSVVHVKAVNYQFLLATSGAFVVLLGETPPDSDGDLLLGAVTFPLTPVSGSGVLVRITLEAAGPGISLLDLQGVKLSDALGKPIQPADSSGVYQGSINPATVAIDAGCGDSDGDGYSDVVEGGTPLCGNGVNDDAPDDGVIDDGCPGGPAKAGQFSEAEFNIGTDPLYPCGLSRWPSDFLWGGLPDSTNRATLSDLTSFLGPTRRLDTSPGDAGYDKRWDLTPGRGILPKWINLNDITALLGGPSGYPPMLGGQRAFNGPQCPYPPQ
jgi:hypothetical protein